MCIDMRFWRVYIYIYIFVYMVIHATAKHIKQINVKVFRLTASKPLFTDRGLVFPALSHGCIRRA